MVDVSDDAPVRGQQAPHAADDRHELLHKAQQLLLVLHSAARHDKLGPAVPVVAVAVQREHAHLVVGGDRVERPRGAPPGVSGAACVAWTALTQQGRALTAPRSPSTRRPQQRPAARQGRARPRRGPSSAPGGRR